MPGAPVRPLVFLAVVACVLSCAGCGSSSTARDAAVADAASTEGFWDALRIDGDWAEYWPTLRELALGADVAVRGTIESLERGATIQGDAPDDVVEEVVLRVRVRETWRGQLTGDELKVTLVAVRPVAELLTLAVPTDPVVVFARRKADRAGEYRLVSGYGLWTRTNRSAIDAPVMFDPPADFLYAPELAKFNSLANFTNHIASLFEAIR